AGRGAAAPGRALASAVTNLGGSEDSPTGGSHMSTTTIKDPIEDARRRIDRLHAFAHSGVAADSSRIRRHLDAVHREEALVLAADPEVPEEIEERLGQLRTRLAVAE